MKILIKHALAGGLARISLYHGLHLWERHISIELKFVNHPPLALESGHGKVGAVTESYESALSLITSASSTSNMVAGAGLGANWESSSESLSTKVVGKPCLSFPAWLGV